ncbi:MAG TPA: hypothetical protein VIX59_06735 [Candidatus Binataceae bacterium]
MALSKKKKPISEKQRESDEQLREQLRDFDLKKFDKALSKAINPQMRERGRKCQAKT